jgi:hypothetical protein
MSQAASGSVPITASRRAVRQVWVYLVITYAIALGVALALPHSELAPLLSILAPVTAGGAHCLDHAAPRATPRCVGGCRFRPTRLAGARPSLTGSSDRRCLKLRHRHGHRRHNLPGADPKLALGVVQALVTTLIFGVVFLGEEIG